jgi:hypothetical protein
MRGGDKVYQYYEIEEMFKHWLQMNLATEELDRIAPVIEEPISITKQQFYEAATKQLKSLDAEEAIYCGATKKLIDGMWVRLRDGETK